MDLQPETLRQDMSEVGPEAQGVQTAGHRMGKPGHPTPSGA